MVKFGVAWSVSLAEHFGNSDLECFLSAPFAFLLENEELIKQNRNPVAKTEEFISV